ncbi:metal ABC transporter ATP-binding protein [Thalassorhabdomicrobium marinisediminis]|uniref:Zinc ABC transporter ATP-binding protein ZnuC n=1 Tax=Thalassorhabdomicrobium marinisediminis TaxID=2170577 RepID=A0A2T7FXG0_9RHOB|nr:metal ABC transporter ATP-binding protein [Thalassorhabdomicrobium marinisediminis]PVA06847.1 zinc ABC transporter ATP-binding protein ZnuC [Thalassorhabdomicrobium marinisediminis]
MSLITAENIEVRNGGTRALFGVSLALEAREIVTVVGPNGSGKSTLMRALIGAVPLQAGRITRRPGLRIGYVPQTLHIDRALPMTVRRFLNLPNRVGRAAARAALARTGVEALEQRQLAGLSGGQLQRVLLARAILNAPHLLVLDEPTQGLDQPASASFYRLIEALRDEMGCAVLMVSHELHVVMSATDRVICLNGHICCEGTPDVVTAAPAYRELFGTGTGGALALYRHEHDHAHDHPHGHADAPCHDHGDHGA